MMMASGSTVLQTAEAGSGGNKRVPCPFHGCKRVYSDPTALESHIKDHEIPAQSVPGKVLLCSSIGCSGSFPDMQKLMEHMRHHHKPNIFFLCESCRTKLRSYRGLLTHLHTCSKVPRGRPKPTEPAAAPAAAVIDPNVTPVAVDQKPPWLDSMSTPQHPSPQIPNPEGSLLAAVLKPDPEVPPVLGPPFLSKPVTSPPQLAPPQLTEAAPLPPFNSESSDVSVNPGGPAAAPDTPDAQGQHLLQTRPPEPVHPAPGSAPCSPPGSSAVWKKTQGMACNRRVLWEHTRGRYTCVQCGHTATNRKEITQHINAKHGVKAAEEAGGCGGASNASC